MQFNVFEISVQLAEIFKTLMILNKYNLVE